jgi:hypothetical protein
VDLGVIFASMILEWEALCVGNLNLFRVEKFWNYKFGVLAVLNTLVFSLLVHLTYPYPHVEVVLYENYSTFVSLGLHLFSYFYVGWVVDCQT